MPIVFLITMFKFPIVDCCCGSGGVCKSCSICSDGPTPEEVTVSITSGSLAGEYTLWLGCGATQPCSNCAGLQFIGACGWGADFNVAGVDFSIAFSLLNAHFDSQYPCGPLAYLEITSLSDCPWFTWYASYVAWEIPPYTADSNCSGGSCLPCVQSWQGGLSSLACAGGWTLPMAATSGNYKVPGGTGGSRQVCAGGDAIGDPCDGCTVATPPPGCPDPPISPVEDATITVS